MKQLRFTTTAPMGMLEMLTVENKNLEKPLIIPEKIGELIEDTTRARGGYIHGEAESLAGFDIPTFIDGNMGQLDLPVAKQDILMVLPSGEYKCKAEICLEEGAMNKYLITLYDEDTNDFLKAPEVIWADFECVNHQSVSGKRDRSREFSEKEIGVLDQIFGDSHKNNLSEKVLDLQLSEKIKALVLKYKKDVAEKGDSIIRAHTGLDFGHVEIHKIHGFGKDKESFQIQYDGGYGRISMDCDSSVVLWTDYSETEPFNRQGNFYIGHRFANLNLHKETPKWREFRKDVFSERGQSCSLPLDEFKFSDFHHTVKFGICVAEKDRGNFSAELRELLGKNYYLAL